LYFPKFFHIWSKKSFWRICTFHDFILRIFHIYEFLSLISKNFLTLSLWREFFWKSWRKKKNCRDKSWRWHWEKHYFPLALWPSMTFDLCRGSAERMMPSMVKGHRRSKCQTEIFFLSMSSSTFLSTIFLFFQFFQKNSISKRIKNKHFDGKKMYRGEKVLESHKTCWSAKNLFLTIICEKTIWEKFHAHPLVYSVGLEQRGPEKYF
jgi:hypothetical protein